MKKVKAPFRAIKKSTPALVIVTFILGMVTGAVLQRVVFNSASSKRNYQSTKAANQNPEQRAQLMKERKETSLKRSKDLVASDLKTQRITQQQADMINKK